MCTNWLRLESYTRWRHLGTPAARGRPTSSFKDGFGARFLFASLPDAIPPRALEKRAFHHDWQTTRVAALAFEWGRDATFFKFPPTTCRRSFNSAA